MNQLKIFVNLVLRYFYILYYVFKKLYIYNLYNSYNVIEQIPTASSTCFWNKNLTKILIDVFRSLAKTCT